MFKRKLKIRFSGSDAKHKNGAAELAIKTVVTMEITMLVHTAIRYPNDSFSTDICLMEMY